MSESGGNDGALFGALKDLNTLWGSLGSSWQDAARGEFEKEYLLELTEAVRSASNAIAQIETVLRQIRKECS